MKKQEELEQSSPNAYILTLILAVIIVGILIAGIATAFYFKNFAFVPFSVVIMGIVSFFSILTISRALSSSTKNAMRRSITVAILVVYLGLLPTLAFQGILQFQVTGNTTTEVTVLNQTTNQTVVQAVPQSIALSETVVTSFTALVAAVLLFYFGSRTLDRYYASKSGTNGNTSTTSEEDNEEETETETTVAKYGEDGKLIEKTVTTEKIKKR